MRKIVCRWGVCLLAAVLLIGAVPMTGVAQGSSDLLFEDDFSDPARSAVIWAPYNGTWAFERGVYAETADASSGAMTYAGDAEWDDYELSATVTPLDGERWVMLSGRVTDVKNRYVGALTSTQLQIDRRVNGVSTILAHKSYSAQANRTYIMKMTFEGDRIRLYIDGTLELEATDTAHSAGSIGLATFKTRVDFDNVTVRRIAAQEETVTMESDLANYQVIQRDPQTESALVAIRGQADSTVARAQAAVFAYGSESDPVVDWTDLSLIDGRFDQTLEVPQGGWYQWRIRTLDENEQVLQTAADERKWGVGILILCIGQSNMVGQGRDTATVADDRVANFKGGFWQHLADPYDGAGTSLVPAMANDLVAALDLPVGVIPAADSGSGLAGLNPAMSQPSPNWYWSYYDENDPENPATLFGRAVTRAKAAGGAELAVWNQGETDGYIGTPKQTYMTQMVQLLERLRSHLGNDALPIFLCQYGPHVLKTGFTDDAYSAVRSALSELDDGENFFLAATEMDIPQNADGIHYTTAGLNTIGHRVANGILYYYRKSAYYRGPSIAAAAFGDEERRTVNVTVAHRGGGDITPADGITGFTVIDGETTVAVTAARKTARDTLRLILASPVSENAAVRYLYGVRPDGGNVVLDDTALRLPLEPTVRDVSIAPYDPAVDPRQNGEYDIVVYGGNASGIVAAIQAAKMGKTVAVVEPNPYRIGGLTTGGLSDTDIGNAGVIGGLALEFYQRVGQKYGKATDFTFEPKVALQVLQEWVAEYPDQIDIFLHERLDLADGVKMDGNRICSITTESGKVFKARVFLDCTYEGDLMALAGVSYTVGREANAVYGETLNGLTAAPNNHNPLPGGISPYIVPGDPDSGLLPRVNPDLGGTPGQGDDKVQAYNFRWTLTNVATNRVAVEKPDNYDPLQYELLIRAFEADPNWSVLLTFKTNRWLKNGKVDANNNSGISTDFIGENYAYPEADYQTRERIVKAHEDYQRGLLWTLQNDERIPEHIRAEAQKWGLAADEFPENDNWPTQLYVREARRMIGDFVMTEQVCKRGSTVYVPDSVGMGSYSMDSHHIQYVVKNGQVVPEGDYYAATDPYAISYRSIVPKAGECANLLVPVCVSASHAAYGSIRMEPVFMVLGQSAATAAALAIDEDVAVQNVSYALLKERLTADKQVLQIKQPAVDQPGVDETVYPVEELVTRTGPTDLENGLFAAAYAKSTRYNRVKTAAVGDYIEFEVPVEKAGTYTVSTQTYSHSSRGTYRLYLPDENRALGGTFDQCGTDYDSPERVSTDTFGEITVEEPTTLRLRFEVTAPGAKGGYTLAFCNVILSTPAEQTVFFDTNGGDPLACGKPVDGALVRPADPVRAGYVFAGWYKDAALRQEWDFDADRMSGNLLTLYAKWIPAPAETYTVSFKSNYGDGGSTVSAQRIAVDGDRLIAAPKTPNRTGFTFAGWYADAAYTDPWDFAADAVSADTVLYAKWEPEEEPPVPVILYGDVDDSGEITAADALMALQAATGKIALDDGQTLRADVDGAPGVTAADALLILQRATGKIVEF
ncbi:MAG: FAD-dependent oxidoreductase [Acutalibacteraceae bacterium]|jgi:uncharacterized repeat protein (TIGR02543 family)